MDKGGEYSLKWNSHKSTVMSAFTCLFENEKHADCTLAAEGKLIKAHKVMISACSPYLEVSSVLYYIIALKLKIVWTALEDE